MNKARLIFSLLLNRGVFCLSRNFRLQAVGDLNWIFDHYEMESILYSIDELIILNVERERNGVDDFSYHMAELTKRCFMPVAAGGGIRNAQDAEKLFQAGADKLVLNTAFYDNRDLVIDLVKRYGSQSIVASIDYNEVNGKDLAFCKNGTVCIHQTVLEAVQSALDLGAGEIYLTCMEKDGTGQGLDLKTALKVSELSSVPLIIAGGAGKYDHLFDGIVQGKANGVATANLFYFMGNALAECRELLIEKGLSMASWDTSCNFG